MKKTLVFPGEPICVVEEFLPGRGVTLDAKGVVKSQFFGKVVYDMNNREVNVTSFKENYGLAKNERVLAEVKDVQEKIAVAEAFAKLPDKPLKYRRTGVLVSRRNDQMENLVGVGDIAVMEVTSIFKGIITLDIYRPGCGVLLASCSVCGRVLEKKNHVLLCGRCGNRERRRTVLKYGNLQVLAELVGVSW
ncbi:MAG: exosome complex RNA-binding protein Csl4 [Candidatus Caldarchaeum sp.]